jgi:hypothetical protein
VYIILLNVALFDYCSTECHFPERHFVLIHSSEWHTAKCILPVVTLLSVIRTNVVAPSIDDLKFH